MSDIREWLHGHDLGQLAEAFEAEQIDFEALLELEDGDLREMGLPIGPRKKVLKAIRELNAPKTEAPEAAPVPDELPIRSLEAERRQITVMFCDLVGSTALSESLDPEELRGVMRAYRKACADVIGRYDGHVAQYLGDGVMVYFGWPTAHEDDAQRAVRAGLDIIDVIAVLEAEAELAVRIGIATGLVVVGESGSDEGADAKLAVGETPNIAARIQGLADPGTVAIAQSTRRLLGGAFALNDLGSHDAKGVSGGLRVHRVLGPVSTDSRFEAAQAAGMTSLVGREHETGLLIERWSQARDGEGQAVLLCGEPGIGKSRIIQELCERVGDDSHIRLRYQCSPYYTNSAFYPVIEQFERAATIVRDDEPEAKLDKMEAALALGSDHVAEVAPLMATMLSLPIERYPPLKFSPQRQKEKTIEALTDQAVGLARSQPVLMLFEDAHWIDPTTLEVLGALIERIQDHPVLLVITYRPEFEPPWSDHGHVTVQILNRLSLKLGAAMVANVTGGKTLPDEVLGQIVVKTDGIPLFVEELTKTVLEAGFLKDDGEAYVLDGPLPALAIPATLQDSLMARLDRLASGKEVAQLGACIGREFAYVLLAAVSPMRDSELQEGLQDLVNSELIFSRGTVPEAIYTFKHALIQDAAYESLLKSRRQQLHRQIGDMLIEVFPTVTDSEPELLAYHYTQASVPERALPYWISAGQSAISRTALVEAIAHLNSGLALIPTLSAPDSRDRFELDLQVALGTANMALRGWPANEVGAAFLPALSLCQRLNRHDYHFSILWGLWVHHATRCEFDKAIEVLDDMRQIGQASPGSDTDIMCQLAMAATLFWTGNPSPAQDCAAKIYKLYSFERHGHLVHSTVHDPLCGTKLWASHWLWVLGYPDQAVKAAEEAIRHAEKLDHSFNLSFTLAVGSGAYVYTKNHTRLGDTYKRSMKIAVEQAFPIVSNWVAVVYAGGEVILDTDGAETLLERYASGLSLWKSVDGQLFIPYARGVVARALDELGRKEEALAEIEEAIELAETSGEKMHWAELVRVKGELLLSQSAGRTSEAAASFEKAIEIAGAQKAKGWELRAATSLARLRQSQGKESEARDLLRPIYDWFTEGFDTADLKDAKALLSELGRPAAPDAEMTG